MSLSNLSPLLPTLVNNNPARILQRSDHVILSIGGDMASVIEPTLASTFWTNESDASDRPRKRRRLGTSLASIDDALAGGLDYGQISCISAPPEAGASDLLLAVLAIHLMSDSTATATFIDSKLAFDVNKLHGLLVKRLQAQGSDASDAMNALDRLKIMKVFDFIGMTESVAEVHDKLSESQSSGNVRAEAAPAVQPPPRGTISDSEDEEEEMLDLSTPPPQPAPRHESKHMHSTMLIIDSISHLTLPLMKNNHTQAQSLLVSFLRSLSHLTTAHDLCTLLVNGTQFQGAAQQAKGDPPSIFSSCTLRPALGQGMGHLLDLHLLVHEVPKTAEEARRVYGGGSVVRGGQKVEMGNVVEVLQDRFGSRVGRWSAFTCAADGRLLTLA